MIKKKKTKRQKFSLKDVKPIKFHDISIFPESKADEAFKDHKNIGKILLECLIDNDSEAFMEILEAYLMVNKTKVAKKADLPRSTVSLAFSKRGNPTIKTIAKIVHEAVALQK